MNRRLTLTAAAGIVAIAAAVSTAPAAAAYPIRDFGELCVGGSAPVSITLLSAKYARYFTAEDLRVSDHNGNGKVCVARVPGHAGHGMQKVPIGFIDDQG